MKLDTSEEQLNNLAAEWREDADIAAVEIISRQESLERFKASSGMADALELLEENPLPAVLVVKPAERLTSTEAVKQLAQRLSAAAAVEQIELDQDWLARLQALLKLIRASVLLLGGMFGAILMLVVGNALRFEIIRRREEIEVVKLVGGSDDYIHRPFMYSAILVGLLGSILAIILILTVFALLRPALSEFLLTYGSRQELLRLGSDTALLLPLIAIGLSLLASWLAIKLNLRYIEPQ
jgi:cell division transport system permease protein